MKKIIKARFLIKFNTGTRIQKPKKGKGSYTRKDNRRSPSFSL